MIPDPTPVVGTEKGERPFVERPSAVIVTTDWRAVATMPVRSSVVARLPVTAAFAVGTGGVVAAGVAPRRPPTRAVVPTDASVADRRPAARIDLIPRDRPAPELAVRGATGVGGAALAVGGSTAGGVANCGAGGVGLSDSDAHPALGSVEVGADHSVGTVGGAQGLGAGSACHSEPVDQSVGGQAAGGCPPEAASKVRSSSLLDV